MTTTRSIPAAILEQHMAVLGKTGSGKTSTAKLAIEQVVAGGARVCILDPIKSDWWGLTSSANGKRAGLPFHILGGPHGHVPLHSAAGKAIADVVATGALPLSIIDMADFEPGGQAKFFVDFAPALLRKMRGVVYLVIEEAHLFAPKERSGIGQENLSIHWAKTMATAGRSKGVRLVLVTQRTQALHNALLGSCDTLIAHRLTAPADQEPVVKWLKANTSKEVLEQVSTSLSSLKTGEGWICSGEAKLFERVQFPRISTYDNTATPTGDGEALEVTTAAVDPEKLRTIIGDAVEKAKADDPRELRKQIAELKKKIDSNVADAMIRAVEQPKVVQKPLLTDVDRALLKEVAEEWSNFVSAIAEKADAVLDSIAARAKAEIDAASSGWTAHIDKRRALFLERIEKARVQKIFDKLTTVETPAKYSQSIPSARKPLMRQAESRPPAKAAPDGMTGPELKILTSLAELEALGLHPADKQQLGLMAGYTNVRSGGFSEPLGRLMAAGYVTAPRTGQVAITDSGRAIVGPVQAPQTSQELQARILDRLTGPERKLLTALIAEYPNSVTKEWLGEQCGYTNIRSGGFSEPLGHLSTLGLVESPDRGAVVASSALFLES